MSAPPRMSVAVAQIPVRHRFGLAPQYPGAQVWHTWCYRPGCGWYDSDLTYDAALSAARKHADLAPGVNP